MNAWMSLPLKSERRILSTASMNTSIPLFLYRTHFGFIAQLALFLNDTEIETVKDVMTYNVVNVTYKAQLDMIPTLKEEEKVQILAWLKEAREYAIDAESSKKKHETFGKYKGRINNYLSKRGYKDADILVEICESVVEAKEETGGLHFKTLPEIQAACVFHKGSYRTLSESYETVLRYIEEKGYEIAGEIRESYIDGVWNQDDESDWLSEIQVPVRKKAEASLQ